MANRFQTTLPFCRGTANIMQSPFCAAQGENNEIAGHVDIDELVVKKSALADTAICS
jgi:hypothetical protein